MNQGTPPTPAWLPVDPAPPPKNRLKPAITLAAIGAGGGALLTTIGWTLDPDPTGPNAALGLRALGAVAALVLLLVARALARPTHQRLGTLFAGLAVLAVTAFLDALIVVSNLADWVRTLSFSLAAALGVALLLALLKKPSADKDPDSLLGFLAEHWLYIGLLAFLVIARIAIDKPMSEIMPDLITNGLFLFLFLSILFRIVTRYLRRFGSPISWTEAKHHRQQVETFSDPHMDEVRSVLRNFIDAGDGTESYDRVMKAAAERVEADVPIDQLLSRRPTLLGGGVRAVPVPILLGATACLAAVLGTLCAVFALSNGVPPLRVLGWFLVGFGASFPLLHRGIKGDPDPDHPLAWLLSAVATSLGLLLVNAIPGIMGLLVPLAPVVAYGLPALRAYLRAQRRPPPGPVAPRAEATAAVRRDATRAIFGVGIIAAFLVLYPIVRYATRRVAPLPPLDTAWLLGLILVVLLLAATAAILGPGYERHSIELKRLHEMERNQRAVYHQRIVETLEGSRA